MKYRLFLIMATAVVLGSTLSCSQNEVVTNDGDQKDPISFNVNVGTLPAPDVTTRGYTTTSAETGYTFSGGEYMAVGLTHTSGSEVIKQYSVGAGSSGNNALTYQKESDGTTTGYTFDWFSTSENVTIRAWSDGKTTTASTPVADPDGQPFTVETTQTGDVKELLYSPATSYAYTTSAINIPLYHQLARIVVTIVRANTSTPISSVTIGHNSTGNHVPIIGTFAKPTGTGVNYGTWSVTSEATQPTHWGVITPKEETAGSVYSAVVIPGGATEYPANTRLFNITIGSESFAYKIPTGGLTLEAGKQYNYTITVENMGITVTSNITDWNAAVPGTDFTHGDGLALIPKYMKNPLWYVSEYYLNSDFTFNKTASTSQGYLFQWSSAMNLGFTYNTSGYDGYALPSPAKTVSNGEEGVTWHIPTMMEIRSILPGTGNQDNYYSSSWANTPTANTLFTEQPCTFGYNDDTKYGVGNTSNPATPTGTQFKSYWSSYTNGSLLRYAIRFIGTQYCSVWRYQILDHNTTNARLVISAKPIDLIEESDLTALSDKLTEIMGGGYDWTENEVTGCVVRSFYLTGFGSSAQMVAPADGEPYRQGDFWTSTKYNSSRAYFMRYAQVSSVDWLYLHSDVFTRGFSVRLFRDN